jgi:ribosomal-protein-alanine N-acetyltransferase
MCNQQKIQFRRMESGDVEQVHALDKISFAMPWSERSYRYEVSQNQNAILWVAEVISDSQVEGHTSGPSAGHSASGGEPSPVTIVGMIVVWFVVDEAHIGTIAVHPDYQRCGIGRRLLAASLLESQKLGAVSALLEVRSSNLAAQNLYKEFQFVKAGVRSHYYQDNGEDALLLNLDHLDHETLTSLFTKEVKR